MPVEVEDTLDYSQVELEASVYKQRRLTANGGTSSLTLSTSSTQISFTIPGNSGWNFHDGFITGDAIFAGDDNNSNVVFTDCLPIESVSLSDANGGILANINNAQIYTKVSQAMSIDMDEYLSRQSVWGTTAIGTGVPISQITGCNHAASIIPDGTDASTVLSRESATILANKPTNASIIDVVAGGDVACVASSSLPSAASGTNHTAASQRLVCGAAEAALAVRFKIPLKAFVGTLLAVNKTLYFGQNLQLTITFKPLANWGFDSTVGVGASISLTFTSFSSIYLMMPQEINGNNMDMLRDAVSRGMRMYVPWTNCTQLSTGAAAATYTLTTPLPKQAGVALKRIITIPVNLANTTKRTANTFNVGNVKFTSLKSSLDSQPIHDNVLGLADSTLWNYMYPMIKGSPAGLSERIFAENCWFMDNFASTGTSTDFFENDVKKSGLELADSRSYSVDVVQTSTGGLQLAQYQTWLREIYITEGSTSWVAVSS